MTLVAKVKFQIAPSRNVLTGFIKTVAFSQLYVKNKDMLQVTMNFYAVVFNRHQYGAICKIS